MTFTSPFHIKAVTFQIFTFHFTALTNFVCYGWIVLISPMYIAITIGAAQMLALREKKHFKIVFLELSQYCTIVMK